jgi:TolB-like protein
MKRVLFFVCLTLSFSTGCAWVQKGTANEVTIRHGTAANFSNIQEKADNHCREYGKKASLRVTFGDGVAIFDCKSESETISPSLTTKQGVPKTEISKSERMLKAPVKPEVKHRETPKIIVRGEKVKVGIIEFQNMNAEAKKENLGTIFSEMLTTSFVNSEAFIITEREQLRKVAQELQLSQSGIIDVTQAKQIGKIVGADAIVTGSVMKIGIDLRLDARIIDVQSGIILTAEKIIGKADIHSMSNMAESIVDNLVNKFYRDKQPYKSETQPAHQTSSSTAKASKQYTSYRIHPSLIHMLLPVNSVCIGLT